MAKTRRQYEADCNALVKYVLSEMEDLASLPPERAADPYVFDERRKQMVRKIWTNWKEAYNHDPCEDEV